MKERIQIIGAWFGLGAFSLGVWVGIYFLVVWLVMR